VAVQLTVERSACSPTTPTWSGPVPLDARSPGVRHHPAGLRATDTGVRETSSIVDTGAAGAPDPGGTLRPIDVVLALRRIPSSPAPAPARSRWRRSRARQLEQAASWCTRPTRRRSRRRRGRARAQPPGDTRRSAGRRGRRAETCAGVPIGANIRVPPAASASATDFFDLLGQRADLLQALFATLFGARRAEWQPAREVGVRDGVAREAAPEPA
jgi:hypothetical protein